MKVLVADDSGVMRKIIIRSLNACGVTDIVEAADGKQGWGAFQAEPIDFVLTDWNMPKCPVWSYSKKFVARARRFL